MVAAARAWGATDEAAGATGSAPGATLPGRLDLASALDGLMSAAPRHGLRVWMVDCGEEGRIWQLAMLVDHASRSAGGTLWEILATAASEAELDKAKAARRAGLSVAQVGEPYRSLYCQPLDKRGRLRITRAFARQIFFARLRPGPLPSFAPFDLIVAGEPTRIPDAHLRLLLRPGGLLAASADVRLAEPDRPALAAPISPSTGASGPHAAAHRRCNRPENTLWP